MPNPNAPFGFADSHRLGAAVNYQMSRRWILPTNPTQIFTGDPVSSLASGYVSQAVPGTPQVAGIFCGCEYMSISQKKWVAVPWWPGNDAVSSGSGFDVMAKIIDDPAMVFRVQANGQLTLAMIGENVNFAIGAGNQATGKSGATIDISTVAAPGATLPFRIVDVVRDPPGSAGADVTTPYSWAYVTFNNQDYKALTGV